MAVQLVKQYSVFLVNKPGMLKNFADLLAKEKVNVIAISQGVRYDAAILRLAVRYEDEISHILTKAGFTSVKTDALCIEAPDQLGLLRDIGAALSEKEMNITAIYGAVTPDGQSRWILTVNDISKALNALETLPHLHLEENEETEN